MSAPSIIQGMDEIALAVTDANSITAQAIPKTRMKLKLFNYFKSLIQNLFNMFTRDSWYRGRLLELYRPLGVETSAVIVVNGKPYEVKYRAVLMDLLESMVLHKLAYDPEARKLLKESIVEMLEDTIINYNGKYVSVKEYFEMRGVPWSKAKNYIMREVDIALNILKQELDNFDNPQPGKYVKGDRLAYYMYVRDNLMKTNKTYGKIVTAVTTSISFSLGVALASRRVFESKGLPAVTKRHTSLEDVFREMLDLPEKLVSKTLQDNPYKIVNEYRFKLNKMVIENMSKAGNRSLGITLSIPISTTELEVYAKRAKEKSEERIDLSRLSGQKV